VTFGKPPLFWWWGGEVNHRIMGCVCNFQWGGGGVGKYQGWEGVWKDQWLGGRGAKTVVAGWTEQKKDVGGKKGGDPSLHRKGTKWKIPLSSGHKRRESFNVEGKKADKDRRNNLKKKKRGGGPMLGVRSR